ncbi:hypothetical protein ACFL6S_27575 [Candidatus Poribacteria bacterium]
MALNLIANALIIAPTKRHANPDYGVVIPDDAVGNGHFGVDRGAPINTTTCCDRVFATIVADVARDSSVDDSGRGGGAVEPTATLIGMVAGDNSVGDSGSGGGEAADPTTIFGSVTCDDGVGDSGRGVAAAVNPATISAGVSCDDAVGDSGRGGVVTGDSTTIGDSEAIQYRGICFATVEVESTTRASAVNDTASRTIG